jgi:hypothetical protein
LVGHKSRRHHEQKLALCAAIPSEKNQIKMVKISKESKKKQYGKLLLSYSNQSTAAINIHLFIYLFNSLPVVSYWDEFRQVQNKFKRTVSRDFSQLPSFYLSGSSAAGCPGD